MVYPNYADHPCTSPDWTINASTAVAAADAHTAMAVAVEDPSSLTTTQEPTPRALIVALARLTSRLVGRPSTTLGAEAASSARFAVDTSDLADARPELAERATLALCVLILPRNGGVLGLTTGAGNAAGGSGNVDLSTCILRENRALTPFALY
jgi:hypothetical protein